jgi:hypothetical protein
MQHSLGVDTAIMRLDLFPFATQPQSRTLPIVKSKRKVLLALTINKHYFIRGIVRYAREHDWYLVTDMMYTGRVPLGWRGDGILTILGYRKELANVIKSAGVPTVAITLVNDKIPLPRVEGDNVKIGQWAAEHFLERGYRHFAWAPFLNDVMDSERHEGFARRLEKRGFACHRLRVFQEAHFVFENVDGGVAVPSIDVPLGLTPCHLEPFLQILVAKRRAQYHRYLGRPKQILFLPRPNSSGSLPCLCVDSRNVLEVCGAGWDRGSARHGRVFLQQPQIGPVLVERNARRCLVIDAGNEPAGPHHGQ